MPYLMHKPMPSSVLTGLMEMDGETLVRVYTRQKQAAWEAAQRIGYFTGSHSAHDADDNADFAYQYEWMRQQMAARMPEFSGDLPIWTWLKRQNERKWVTSWHKEDRATTPNHPRIIALVPRKRILLSCYDLWHAHLNNWNVALTHEQHQAYDTKWPKYKQPGEHPEYQRDTEENWGVVFDVHLPRTPYLEETHGRVNTVQACVDRIYLNEIQSVRWAT